MTYRANKKRLQQRSAQGVAEKERLRRITAGAVEPYEDPDPYIKITIERRATGETAVFECTEGNAINNYSVTCNGVYQGVQSITTITKNIRKALPSFRRME
jgi:hypothetical protein